MKEIKLLILLVFVSSNLLFTQNKIQKISSKVCECINNKSALHSDIIMSCLEAEFQQEKYLNLSDSLFQEVTTQTYFYLNKNCKKFAELSEKEYPEATQGDWRLIQEVPMSELSIRDFKNFFKHKTLYYLESTGKVTRLNLSKKFWIDNFEDGSYSKCMVSWIRDRDFEIIYMDSNNPLRKRMSKKGDKYQYRILKKLDTYYLATASYGEVNYQFKIYFIDPSGDKI